ncbi:HAD family hydrolase [Candidatus Stoquefichus massiliensis]|uniref:HAD family hydrolase n=1 Tax=Candidatus Stoquefichus massiliensis TaxID=1470350 RepID=UPI0004889C25|nr:HAD family phosphatase [Candidatus Stoquefichus massiliensis]
MKPYIIFDMDGVIIDSETWYYKILQKYLREKRILISESRLEKSIGLSTEDFYLQNEDMINISLQDFINDYHTYINEYGIPRYEELVFPHIKDCFFELYQRGIDIIIASSSSRQTIQDVLSEIKLQKFVEFYLGAENVEKKKPNPEIYLKIVDIKGYKPLFVVEDSYYGIQSAKAAKLKVIAYSQNVNNLNQSESDLIVYDHLEILKYC